jgi:hypothetical protein
MTSTLSAGFAASGVADGPDAVRDAVSAALDELGRSASFVLVFPPATLQPQTVVEQANAAASGVPWAGMSSDGVIAAGAVARSGCAALAFGDDVAVGVGLGEGASHDSRGVARRAAAAACAGADAGSSQALLLLLYDAEAGLHAELVAGAYEVVGPRVRLAGGGANAPLGSGSEPVQFARGRACRNSVVAVALVTRAPVAIGIGHGCELGTLPAIVTRSEGRRILGLDGRPAEDAYLEAIGHDRARVSDSEFERIATLHPLVQLELSGRVRPRHVRGRAPGGGLLCAGAIPEDAAVAFAEQSPEGVRSSALTALRDALAQLPGPARAVLVFACAARRAVLGIEPQAEVEALASALGSGPLVGLYTRGEIARTRGASGDLNHAIVIIAFA